MKNQQVIWLKTKYFVYFEILESVKKKTNNERKAVPCRQIKVG